MIRHFSIHSPPASVPLSLYLVPGKSAICMPNKPCLSRRTCKRRTFDYRCRSCGIGTRPARFLSLGPLTSKTYGHTDGCCLCCLGCIYFARCCTFQSLFITTIEGFELASAEAQCWIPVLPLRTISSHILIDSHQAMQP